MARQDYAFPFAIAPASRQGAQSSYEDHMAQMIRQVLLTDPGERIDLPNFGAGLRRLIFAPLSDALAATTQMMIQQGLNQWLAGQIVVNQVLVTPPESTPVGGELQVLITYTLVETQTQTQLLLAVQ